MKARRKGTNNPYINIDKVQLQDSDILFSAEVMEFELHTEDCIKSEYPDEYWDKLKHQAAIAAMQGMIICGDGMYALAGGNYCYKQAVEYAENLIEKLKGE